MAMEQEVLKYHKSQRVCIFKLPPTTAAKGYLLDDWKDMVFEGSVKVFQKGLQLRLVFAKKDGTVFAQTKLPENPFEAIVKTKDSSRGFGLRLQNPKGGYAWVGLVFRDRNDAFDFNVTFVDILNLRKRDKEVELMKDQPLKAFGDGSQKIKIAGFGKKKETETEESDFSFGFGLSSGSGAKSFGAGFGQGTGFGKEQGGKQAQWDWDWQGSAKPGPVKPKPEQSKWGQQFDWGKWQQKAPVSQPTPPSQPPQPKKAEQINLLDLF